MAVPRVAGLVLKPALRHTLHALMLVALIGIRVGEAAVPGPARFDDSDVSDVCPLSDDASEDAPCEPCPDNDEPHADGSDTEASPPVFDVPADARRAFQGIPFHLEDAWRTAERLVAVSHTAAAPSPAATAPQPGAFTGPRPNMYFGTVDGTTGYWPDMRANTDASAGTHHACESRDRCAHFLCLDSAIPAQNGIERDAPPARNRPRRRRRNPDGSRYRGPRRATIYGPLPKPLERGDPDLHAADASWRCHGLWAIDTANPNAWAAAREYLTVSSADVALLQEHRVPDGEAILRTAAAAKAVGWQFLPEPALRTGTAAAATSAGVGVAAKKGFGYRPSQGEAVPPEYGHRIAHSWVAAVCRGGLHCISLYLNHSEGLSEGNLDLLDQVIALTLTLKGPWLLGGDFNMPPQVLEASGFLQAVGGRIAAPTAATCNGSVYDFFIVSRALAPLVHSVFRVAYEGFSPHSAVRLLLRGDGRRTAVRKLVKPARVSTALPAGPLVDPSTLPPLPTHDDIASDFNAAASSWNRRANAEWTSLGADRSMPCRCTPKFTWAPLAGTIADPVPGANSVVVLWRSLAKQALRAIETIHSSPPPHTDTLANATASVNWAVSRSTYDDQHEALRHWLSATSVAVLAEDVHGLRSLHDSALSSAHACCRANRHRERKAWLHHIRGTGQRRADGYQPMRAAFQYARGPVGWTLTATADTECDAAVPDVVADYDEEQLLRAAELHGIACPGDVVLPHGISQGPVVQPMASQADVEAEANVWAGHWDEGKPYECAFGDTGPPPPALSAFMLQRAAATFPPLTGHGADNRSPRAFLRLSQDALEALALILWFAEAAGQWPSITAVVLIVLLPKTDGGRRPIGLFDSTVRIWMRARLDIARAWEHANSCPAMYGGSGMGAQRAAWQASFHAEAAALSKCSFAQSLLDLVKAFERVPHAILIRFAQRFGYCLKTLRMSIAAYRLARSIGVDGVYSRLVVAVRGITAGSGLATTELKIVLLDMILIGRDLFSTTIPCVVFTLYVDDLTLQASGRRTPAARVVAEATDFAVHYLEETLDAKVSPTKSVVIADSSPTMRAVQGFLRTSKVRPASHTKLLGVSAVGGRRRSMRAVKQRLKAFRAKTHRLHVLRKAGINTRQVVRAIGTPSYFYGVSCYGVSDSLLQAARAADIRAIGSGAAGKSLDATFTVADACGATSDPAFAAHTEPIVAFATAWWQSWVPAADLHTATANAVAKLARASNVWAAATGPVAGAVASLHRLAWRFTAPSVVATDEDRVLDFTRDPPAVVARFVATAVRRWRLARLLQHWPALLPPPPRMPTNFDAIQSRLLPPHVHLCERPLATLMRPTKRHIKQLPWWEARWRPYLRSTASGAQWPQARLAAVPGWTDDRSCQLCGHEIGSCAHRPYCPANVPHGGWPAPSDAAARGLARLTDKQRHILDAHGLVCLRMPVPRPPSRENIIWLIELPPDIDQATVTWYIDGSLVDGNTPFARLGAGFIAIAADGSPCALGYGVPPPWIDTIPGAEAWAYFVAIQGAPALPKAVTDCLGNRTTLLAGHQQATLPSKPLARIWAAIFTRVDGIPYAQRADSLDWMPAHTAWEAIGVRLKASGRPVTGIDWRANALVDAAAKTAARSTRAPKHLRLLYDDFTAAATYGAAIAGAACFAANNHTTMVTSGTEVVNLTLRDSIGKPHGFFSDTASTSECRRPSQAGASPRERRHPLYAALPPDFPLREDAIALPMAAATLRPPSVSRSASPSSAEPARPSCTPTPCSRHGPPRRSTFSSSRHRAALAFGKTRVEAIAAASLANAVTAARDRATSLPTVVDLGASHVATSTVRSSRDLGSRAVTVRRAVPSAASLAGRANAPARTSTPATAPVLDTVPTASGNPPAPGEVTPVASLEAVIRQDIIELAAHGVTVLPPPVENRCSIDTAPRATPADAETASPAPPTVEDRATRLGLSAVVVEDMLWLHDSGHSVVWPDSFGVSDARLWLHLLAQ